MSPGNTAEPRTPVAIVGAGPTGLSLPLGLGHQELRSPDGAAIRLYDLLPKGPVILDVGEDRDHEVHLPVDEVIRIGPGGHHDPTGSLRRLLGQKDGWILVRPDAHIAWARSRDQLDGIDDAAQHALGGKLWSGAAAAPRE